ncbi:AAEL003632-PA [Aedes aegypti]|uniref:CLIP domain-containing serine protease n=1 Tax=Aedes aegypti TaxID=7159 RepID=Q17EX7_AEDAE|nr:AAEL003632-PA [Aedes aegypti]
MSLVITIDSRVLLEDSWEPIQCDLPGLTKRGICTAASNCEAYQRILNESRGNSIEREDFIQQLQCGKFEGDRVCCPDSDSYQIGVYEDAATCGQAAYGYRIRGGVIADIDEFPWMAMLLKMHRKSQSLYYHCGGVLIGKQFVLTAAHCISPKNGDSKQDPLKYVRLREYDVYQDPDCMMASGFMDCSEEKLDMKPRKLIAHPGFTVGSQDRNHDIGLIQIDPIPTYSDFLLPICLPETGFDQGDRRGRMHNVAGWGKTDFFSGSGSISWSPIKMKVALPFVAWEVCRDVYKPMGVDLQRTQICAGGKRARDSCAGDSGSPLMYYDMKNAVWVLTGIASFGVKDCGMEGIPGVYSSVKEHLSWIKESISSA